MPDLKLYEYAVLRLVPRVDREEFLNMGVVLYCREAQFLECTLLFDPARILAFSPGAPLKEWEEHLCTFQKICAGAEGSGPIGALPIAQRFRWLTATRSTIIQSSRVHPGLCSNPAITLEQLHQQLVVPPKE